jgi:CRISPR-associated protein Cas2
MVVMILERVPVSLRGELSRRLLEPKAGVFVGRVSGMVREKLWEKVCRGSRTGACIMIHSDNTEQGFSLKVWGEPKRKVMDFEGLFLIRIER